jgi:hypothetical protein
MKQLPVWNTFKESVLFAVSNWGSLGKLLLVPLVLDGGFEVLRNSFLEDAAPIGRAHVLWIAMMALLGAFSGSLWAPQWIQHYADPTIKLSFFKFQKIEWKFFGYSFLVSSFLIGPLILLGVGLAPFLPHEEMLSMHFSTSWLIVAVLSSLIVGFWLVTKILARFSFLWPSLAYSDSTNLKHVWEQTEPYQKKLMCIQSFVTILVLFWVKFKNPITSFPLILASAFLDSVILIYFTKLYQASKKERKSK